MRTISTIILHHTASDTPEHDSIDVLKRWHLERGFSDVGYHIFIKRNGDIQLGRPIDKPGAHCKGFNTNSIGIALHGCQVFSTKQLQTTKKLLLCLMTTFGLTKENVKLHKDFNKSTICPNYTLEDIFTQDLQTK